MLPVWSCTRMIWYVILIYDSFAVTMWWSHYVACQLTGHSVSLHCSSQWQFWSIRCHNTVMQKNSGNFPWFLGSVFWHGSGQLAKYLQFFPILLDMWRTVHQLQRWTWVVKLTKKRHSCKQWSLHFQIQNISFGTVESVQCAMLKAFDACADMGLL